MVDVTKSKDGEVYTCKGTNSKSMEESSFVDATYTMNVLCKCFKFVRDLNSSHTQVKCAIFFPTVVGSVNPVQPSKLFSS